MIDRALDQHPDNLKIAMAHAQLASTQRDWGLAVERWQHVLSLGHTVPLGAMLQLSQAHRYQHDLDAASALMAEAQTRFPDEQQVAIELAEIARSKGDWSSVVKDWTAIIERYGDAPATGYVRLSQASRYLGKHTDAGVYAEQGIERYPEDQRLAIEHAEVAMALSNWMAAIGRWQNTIDRFQNDLPASVYVRKSTAHRRILDFDESLRTLSQCPLGKDDDLLAMERAEVEMGRENWSGATQCLEEVLNRLGDTAPAIAFVRRMHLYCRAKDYEGAESLFQRARQIHPEDTNLLVQHVDTAVSRQDWVEVIERAKDAIATGLSVPKAHLRYALAHRVLGEPQLSSEVAAKGLAKHPGYIDLAQEYAEGAMAKRDWSDAITRWDQFLTFARRESTSVPIVLPIRSGYFDWYECDWETMTRYWLEKRVETSPFLYRKVAEVLVAHGWDQWADKLLGQGRSEHPANISLAIQYAELSMTRRDWPIARERWREVLHLMEGKAPARVFEGLCLAQHMLEDNNGVTQIAKEGSQTHSHLASFGAELKTNQQIFEELAPKPGQLPEQLDAIPLCLVRCQRQSSVFNQIRAGTYLSRQTITRRLGIISERLGAIHTSRGMRSLKRAAWLLAKQYADAYQRSPHLPANVLAQAVQFHFMTELATLLPIRHIARRLAYENVGTPIFVELPSRDIRCLKYWTDNEMEPLFLYVELRRCGANAILVLPEDEEHAAIADSKGFALRFALDLSWERTASLPLTSGAKGRAAIIPAGIRGLDRVIASSNDSHLFPSAHVINPRPYSARHQVATITFTDTIYPPDLQDNQLRVAFKSGPSLICGEKQDAQVYVAKDLDLNLFSNLDRLWGETLAQMANAAVDQVDKHAIEEAHVCDHHFLESTLMEHAVVRAGGKITVWPHSTNPVDYKSRCPRDTSRIVCITKSSQQIWKAHLPDVPVEIRSDLMLPAPSVPRQYDPHKPLTVVVIGGGSLMGRLPALSLGRHRESYRQLFLGLQTLGSAVNIVFKPKGVWLETVAWLHRVLNGQVPFQVASTHPLHIDFPNMVFVTVSFGSSALLEGMSRGIPALIVRNFPVADYTTIDTQIVPAKTTGEIIDELRTLASPERWQQMVKAQMEYYRSEIGDLDGTST
jgi:tetratricopeptide (TPR) repeat protein